MRALLALSGTRAERQGTEDALALSHRALALAEAHLGPDLVAICHSQTAMLLGRSGRPLEALTELDLAIAGGTGMAPRDRFVVLLSRGMVRMELGRAAGAAEDFAEAAALSAEHAMVRQEFMARHNLGCAAQLAGDLPRALRIMLEADRLPVDISRAVAWLDRGRVLLEAGLVSEAVELLDRAADEGRDREQHQVQGEIELELARALILLGDPAEALARARRARREFGRRGVTGWQRRAEVIMLQARGAQARPSRGLAADALALAEDLGSSGDPRRLYEARLMAAEAAARTGDWDTVSALAARLSRHAGRGGLETRMRWRRVSAMAAGHRGDHAAAARQLRVAADDLRRSRSVSSSLDLRAAVTLHAGPLEQLDVELARSARPPALLVALERWRSLASEPPPVRPPADPELAEGVVTLRRLRAEARSDPGDAEVLERIRSLEIDLAGRFWSAQGTRTPTSGPSGQTASGQTASGRATSAARPRDVVRRVVAELGERDTDLAAFVRGRGSLAAVVVRRGRSRLVELGTDADLDELARRLGADLSAAASVLDGPLAGVVRASLASTLQRYRDTVLAPLDLGERAVVVPCDGLTSVPWGMVPGRVGLPTTVVPSLSAWLDGTTRVRSPRVSVVAGPGLPSAAEEAERVAAAWEDDRPCLPDLDAAAQDVRAALESSDVVHVSAHGTHHPESPVFSSLWMADGPVFLCDLEGAQIRSSLVVISACEAGRSRRRAPVSHLGLATGLLTLGVGSVVASPCKVPDATAAAVMGDYHERLRAGEDGADALALAAAGCDDPMAGAFQTLGGSWRADS
ncbi:CHAT domain-containing protein [Ornithinimicrobium avium]|uniref:CHAT domain-containing protein n=1 Tax=Ornithinimicrobium avium TaxID=2283195 RepID=A0A345NLH9_9MICO|nr:CHAT domain-containing protein [Ornithinimicrobium avium]AXH95887.1 CHAT domain-containing protein [Ornithinimicrobium avium]